MARSSGGGRSYGGGGRSYGGGSFGGRPAFRPSPRPAAASPPPPEKDRKAPPPAKVQSSGGPSVGGGGGFLSSIADGMGFGAGSSIAHRAVDFIMGPRTIQVETVASEAPRVSTACAEGSCRCCGPAACSDHSKAFQDCLATFGSEISRCQFYMDMLAECKKNSGGINV